MAKDEEKKGMLVVDLPKFKVAEFEIVGTSPLVMNRFSEKAKKEMIDKQKAGGAAKATKTRQPKDFEALANAAAHRSDEGWYGIPAAAFRNAMISACKAAEVVMTRAKLSVFIIEDGYDDEDPLYGLVKITQGEPKNINTYVRLATGVADIHPRPMWKPGWRATVRVRFDSGMMSTQTVMNLLVRAGIQVGVLEGRADSKRSNGMGWGCFSVVKEIKEYAEDMSQYLLPSKK